MLAEQTLSKVCLSFCQTCEKASKLKEVKCSFISSQNTLIHLWQRRCKYVFLPAVQVEQAAGSY